MLGFPFLIVYGILWFGFWLMRHFFGVHVSDDVAIAILAGSAIIIASVVAVTSAKVSSRKPAVSELETVGD